MTEAEMTSKIETAAGSVETVCGPKSMNQADAVSFLEGVIERLKATVAGIKEDMNKT